MEGATMAMTFDATMKTLAAGFPRDFLTTFDAEPTGQVQVLNVDLSTVTTSADFVVGLGEPVAEIIHIDFQSSADEGKHADVFVYNALLHRRYRVPVHSMVLLLRPTAAHSNMTGNLNYTGRQGRGKMDFDYELVRVWEIPAEKLLRGVLGTAPLAVLGQLPQGVELQVGLTGVAQQLIQRLDAEASEGQRRNLLTAAFLLTGMRVPRDVSRTVFAGVKAMHESDTYMAVIDEGREIQLKTDIRKIAVRRYGGIDDGTNTKLQGITDLERLERIFDRLLDAPDWQDLLDTP
jgi:hypothetical protein